MANAIRGPVYDITLSITGRIFRLWRRKIAAFNRWGYPHELMYVIGALEVAGALGLLLAITRRAACWGLSALMLGACATHIAHAEYGMLVVALTIMVGLFAVQQAIPLLANKKAGQSL